MNAVLQQLNQWRFRERLVRFCWGAARTLAVLATVLAVACAIDWVIDRYSGSEAWRKTLRSTGILAPSDPLSVGHTPFGLRLLMTLGQLALAAGLVYYLILRPWLFTPRTDELASRAEKAFPDFDHRLVTAIQLNRPDARTDGMSKTLIADVTREAGEIATRHNFLSLINYRRLRWAITLILPVLLAWGVYAAFKPELAKILVQRQALLDVEIPRNIHLKNVTRDVWPTGTEVIVRFEVSGEFAPESTGTLRIVPISRQERLDDAGKPMLNEVGKPILVEEIQPEEFYELTNEKNADGSPASFFSVKLPPASLDFSFQARLEDGRTVEPGRVRFEAPPQLGKDDPTNPPLTAEQILPSFLGVDPRGNRFVRRNDGWTRGEVIDAVPGSAVIVDARFNKPVRNARLIPIERVPTPPPGTGYVEADLPPVNAVDKSADGVTASFVFPTTPRMIGYRLELEDSLGFTNPTPIRRNVRMWEDRPPVVEFRPETTRNPDPGEFDGQGNPKDYEWDMALGPDGLVMVIYNARSEVGIRNANIRYRVVPRGVQFDLYPEEYKNISHPREDPNLLVYDRLPLSRVVLDPMKDLGPFVSDLGLFTYSYRGVSRFDRNKVNAEFYAFPSRDAEKEPGQLEAGGRRNFEVAGLLKKIPELQSDGSVVMKNAKLEIGDTVEVYVEVFDKLPGPDGKPDLTRPAGYTREAKRKIVVSEADAAIALRQRDEARTKLRDKLNQLAQDQTEVFKPKER